MPVKYFFMIFIFTIIFLLLPQVFVSAQEDVVLSIGNKNITLNEFERLYRKNNSLNIAENQDVNEYLEQFINFKLKVVEAENLGLDTTKAFKEEFNMYRKELIKPYMIDSLSLDELLRHSYNKLIREINASHILIAIDPEVSKSDTLNSWNKIMEIRKAAVKGADFGNLAVEFSDDPSAKINNGYLGWFSAFRMVYEFEEAAYATPVGKISMPVRTRFGYHIIKVHDVRPARGSVQTCHIFIASPESYTENEAKAAKEKIISIRDSLNLGVPFEEMALKYSDDRNSATQGGVLQWFSTGMMIPEFENAAFTLKDTGSISEPVKSGYGWHLIKLLNKKPVRDFNSEKPELLNRLNSGMYSEIKYQKFIEKIKADYKFQLDKTSLEAFYTLVDTGTSPNEFLTKVIPESEKLLFSIGEKKVNMGEFAEWIEKTNNPSGPFSINSFIDEEFNKFADSIIYNYKESVLETEYPELKFIINEYHDGILLFELTEKMVWDKAVQDTIELEAFFKKNYRKYKWNKRVEAFIITFEDYSLVDDARKFISKFGKKKNFGRDMLLAELCPNDSEEDCFTFVSGKFEKGTNRFIDDVSWKRGLKQNIENNGNISVVYIRKIIKPEYKTLDETRGLVISDFQEYLEKKWVAELRNKYPVKVNRDILSKMN